MENTQVLIKPLLSEKTTLLKEQDGTIAFYVHPKASKYDITLAIEELFNVTVQSVNVVKYRPRVRKKMGRAVGREPGYKKAYVNLASGDTIEFFEGV
ncbi:50S ribosomal protein L23 [Desulfoplanes sp.]